MRISGDPAVTAEPTEHSPGRLNAVIGMPKGANKFSHLERKEPPVGVVSPAKLPVPVVSWEVPKLRAHRQG